MIETTTIARPYAKAAFGVACATDSIDAWDRFLQVLTDILAQPDVILLFESPQMTHRQVAELLTGLLSDILKDAFSQEQRNFVVLLAENDRFSAVGEMRRQFEERKDRYQGVAEADIATALPIDDDMLSSLVRSLEAHFGCKIRTRVTVEPELIGGVKIAVGDEVIDASVRGKLNSMAVALTQ